MMLRLILRDESCDAACLAAGRRRIKGGIMSRANKVARVVVVLSHDDLKAVDDFRFRHRIPSRAAAVRQILKLGLAAGGDVSANAEKRDAKS